MARPWVPVGVLETEPVAADGSPAHSVKGATEDRRATLLLVEGREYLLRYVGGRWLVYVR